MRFDCIFDQVELLDERSKQYSFAGDDNVSGAIADLIRGVLCPAIKWDQNKDKHGLKTRGILDGFFIIKLLVGGP